MLVTAVSANHLSQVRGMLRSAQAMLPPSWPLVLYDLVGDLGEADLRAVRTWCRVEYRRLEGSYDARYLTNSGWKPLVIAACIARLPAGGILVYADASMRFMHPLTSTSRLLSLARCHGFVGKTAASPLSNYTHPDMLGQLARLIRGGLAEQQLTAYSHAPMVCGCVGVFINVAFTREHIISPWVACATTPACILPAGADGFKVYGSPTGSIAGFDAQCRPGVEGHCHRGDQSALSVILYELYGRAMLKRSKEARLCPPQCTTGYTAPEVSTWAWTRRGNLGLQAGPCFPLEKAEAEAKAAQAERVRLRAVAEADAAASQATDYHGDDETVR